MTRVSIQELGYRQVHAVANHTLESARSEIEAKFAVWSARDFLEWAKKNNRTPSISPVGLPFEIIVNGHHREEGAERPLEECCLSGQVAIDRWYNYFSSYASGKSGTLYWRIEPSYETYIVPYEDKFGLNDRLIKAFGGGTVIHSIYSRFIISYLPVIELKVAHG